jgi:DNA-binding FadR family transcriptional regulator
MTKAQKRDAIKAGADGLRIHQAIARQLGTAILTGKFAPGDSLGGEIDASEQLGISRTSYREAIRILIAKGLIESKPKAGTHVLPRRRWNLLDPDMLAWMFSQKPDPAFVRDLFELRGIIEPEAAALAAERRSEEHLAGMATALAGMREHTLAAEAGQAADQDFHSTMLDAAGNMALASLIGSVGAAVRWTTHFKLSVSTPARDSLPDHEAVYLAIAAGDTGGARAAMHELLRLARIDVMKLVV